MSSNASLGAIRWTLDPNNPVIIPGQLHGELDAFKAAGGHVVRIGDRYRMYYLAISSDNVKRVCMAESPVERPNDWRGIGVALAPQKDTFYNYHGPLLAMVLPQDDGPWLMYVTTQPKEPHVPGLRTWYAGLALSYDNGITWEYATQESVIPSDRPYDSVGIGTMFVLREGDEYRMYYTALAPYEKRPPEFVSAVHSGDLIPIVGIGYAVSQDGIHWEKPYDDYLIPPRRNTVTPYENWIARPMILKEDCGYRMWLSVTGVRYRICSLTSTDGLAWEWVPCNVAEGDIGVGAPGTFDDQQRSYADVVKEGDEYRMWYTGNGPGATGMGYATGRAVSK
jgi:predicted GH43/DUF377 family glycosyl hydrolase